MGAAMQKYECDVLVAGGGTAGAFAALAAARTGADTILMESAQSLGGQLCAGMGAAGAHDAQGHTAVAGLLAELEGRVRAFGAGPGYVFGPRGDRWVPSMLLAHPVKLEALLSGMLQEAGVRLLFQAPVCGARMEEGRIRAVRASFMGETHEVAAKAFVDCTGDAVLGKLSGAECFAGDGDGRFQSVSMVFSLGNVGLPDFERYMNEVVNCDGRPRWELSNCATRGCLGQYWLPWKFSPERARLPGTIGVYWFGNEGELFFNVTHLELDCLDPFAVSEGIVRLRAQAQAVLDFLRRSVPGCERAHISFFAPLGIRESRRIAGQYVMKAEDLCGERSFPDEVCRGAYPPDVHRGEGEVDIATDRTYNYGIPLRALVSRDVGNLLMAGRCLSAESGAAFGLRGMAVCAATGQAAGTAAALAAGEGIEPKKYPAGRVQKALRAAGAVI